MQTLVFLLLILNIGCCTEDYKFVTKTVAVGQNVSLMCPRGKSSLYQETLFWIRLSGNWPEFIGATFNFESDVVTKDPHMKAEKTEESFILHINEIKLNDTGLYYCGKVKQLNMKFTIGTFLEIKEPESGITALIQELPSDPIHPGDPVTLQCSVLSDSDRKTCSADHRVYWFRSGSDESHPSLIYAHGNSSDECERSPEDESVKKCVYSFSRNVRSDSGTYYCAVAACGRILFGLGTKLDTEGIITSSPSVNVVFSICVILAIIVMAVPIYFITERHWYCCKDKVAVQGSNGTWKNLQKTVQDKRIYTAVVFTEMKAEDGGIKVSNAKIKKIYTAVNTFLHDS